MDFNKLLATMRELDAPVSENCMANMAPPMAQPAQNLETPPTMNVNFNAQGIENIENIMKLFTKVNPDMNIPGDANMPAMSIEPLDISAIPGVEPDSMNSEPEVGPIELPTTPSDTMIDPAEKDAEPEMDQDDADDALADEPDPQDDESPAAEFNSDDDYEDDEEEPGTPVSDEEGEEEEGEEKETDEGVYANSPDEKEHDIDTMINKLSGGINDGEQGTYPKVAGGDNPMQKFNKTESKMGDVQAIKEALRKELNKVKGITESTISELSPKTLGKYANKALQSRQRYQDIPQKRLRNVEKALSKRDKQLGIGEGLDTIENILTKIFSGKGYEASTQQEALAKLGITGPVTAQKFAAAVGNQPVQAHLGDRNYGIWDVRIGNVSLSWLNEKEAKTIVAALKGGSSESEGIQTESDDLRAEIESFIISVTRTLEDEGMYGDVDIDEIMDMVNNGYTPDDIAGEITGMFADQDGGQNDRILDMVYADMVDELSEILGQGESIDDLQSLAGIKEPTTPKADLGNDSMDISSLKKLSGI